MILSIYPLNRQELGHLHHPGILQGDGRCPARVIQQRCAVLEGEGGYAKAAQ